jgi:hypothetical protein
LAACASVWRAYTQCGGIGSTRWSFWSALPPGGKA